MKSIKQTFLQAPGRLLSAVCLAALFSGPALAGANCDDTPLLPEAVADAFDAALGLETWLNQHKPDVAIIARRGQNLDEYGLRYSHAGFAVRNAQTGAWTVVHELNACGTAVSGLHEQGLAEFFSGNLQSTEVAVSVPVPELQQQLLKALSPANRFLMHHANYSAVAYPYALKYQNSNGWLLETFVNAVGNVGLTGREQAQAVLQQQGYKADVMVIRAAKRLGARMFRANVEFDDHPSELRWSNRITAHTGDSTMRFVSKWGAVPEGCKKSQLGPKICVVE